MTAHELARKLLAEVDVPVFYTWYAEGVGYIDELVTGLHVGYALTEEMEDIRVRAIKLEAE